MVYKKYIKKDGKFYGPYIYESKRVDGKVVSEYHGPKRTVDLRKFAWIFISAVIILSLAYFLSTFDFRSLTGKAILNTDVNYTEKQPITGNVNLLLKQGELLPINSKLILENSGQVYEYNLDEVISNKPVSGDFYIDGISLSGKGNGYGIEGEKLIYPEVSFILQIYQSSEENQTTETENISQPENPEINNSANETISNETINIPENNLSTENETALNESIIPETNTSAETTANETINTPENNSSPANEIISEQEADITEPTSNESTGISEPVNTNVINPEAADTTSSENPTETIQDENNNVPEQANENPTETETPPIIVFFMRIYNFFLTLTPTGNTISQTTEINGQASFGNPFVYNLSGGEGVQLKPGSVSVSGSAVSDDNVQVSTNANHVIVETSYSTMEKGFGAGYSGNDTEALNINLSKLGLVLNEGELIVKIVYNDNEIISSRTFIIPGINKSTSENVSNSTIMNVTIEQNVSLMNSTQIPQGLQIITAETASLVLTEEEKTLLAQEFGADSKVETSESEVFNGRIFVKHEIGKEWIEYSYDPNLPSDKLEYQISLDRMKWLKDLAYRLKNNQNKVQQNTTASENFSIAE